MFECSFEEFKTRSKEFKEAAPSLNKEELDGAWKALALSYFGMNEPRWEHSASIVLRMMSEICLKREVELEESINERCS